MSTVAIPDRIGKILPSNRGLRKRMHILSWPVDQKRAVELANNLVALTDKAEPGDVLAALMLVVAREALGHAGCCEEHIRAFVQSWIEQAGSNTLASFYTMNRRTLQ